MTEKGVKSVEKGDKGCPVQSVLKGVFGQKVSKRVTKECQKRVFYPVLGHFQHFFPVSGGPSNSSLGSPLIFTGCRISGKGCPGCVKFREMTLFFKKCQCFRPDPRALYT